MQHKKTNSNIRPKDPFAILTDRYKNSDLKSSYRSKWSEDAFIADSKPQETMGHNFNFKYIILIIIILSFSLFILLAKTAYLQLYKGDYYSKMAEGNRIRISRIEARRGVIYDQKLRPLVRNKANFMLYLIPADLPEEGKLNKIFEGLEEILGHESLEKIHEKLNKIVLISSLKTQELRVRLINELEKLFMIARKMAESAENKDDWVRIAGYIAQVINSIYH